MSPVSMRIQGQASLSLRRRLLDMGITKGAVLRVEPRPPGRRCRYSWGTSPYGSAKRTYRSGTDPALQAKQNPECGGVISASHGAHFLGDGNNCA